jgi:thiamine-monophosphate kinase
LLSDLGWICRLSRVGAEVHLESLPILPVVRRHLESRGIDPAAWSAASGEEFELLFTTRVEVERLRTEMRRRGIRTPITAIGKTVSRPGIRWLRGGKALRLDAGEVFAHFSQGGGPGRT